MKTIAALLAYIGLALTFVPSVLVFMKVIDVDLHKTLMLIGTVLWFIAAPIWFSGTRESKT